MTEEKRNITAEDVYKFISVEDPRISPDGRWIAYVQVAADKMENGYKRNIWLASTSGGNLIQLTRSNKDTQPRWSPDGQWLAFTSARDEKPQIYVLRIGDPGGEARALTSMMNGANSPAWSPDGSQIAFLAGMNAAERVKEDSKEEETKPADKLEGKHRKERKELEETKRWDPRVVWRIPYRSGTSYLSDRFTQVYVMATAEGLEKEAAKPRRLTGADADHNAPQWTPDGEYILTGRMDNPEGDEPWRWSNLYRVRVADGTQEKITDDVFTCFGPLPSPDGQWIAFGRVPHDRLSERITRLSVMPAAGGETQDLTMGLNRNIGDYKWMPDSSGLLFTALDEGNIEIYRVLVGSGEVEKVISGVTQIEQFDINEEAGIAYTAGTPENPSELYWQDSSVDEAVQMTHVNEAFLNSIFIQEFHEMRWQSSTGEEIQGWYMLPTGYKEGETYPLVVNIHGGPHVMWGPGMKSMWQEWQFHAARGYAVFFCNPRGADGYGEEFQLALHGKWGSVAMDDILTGMDLLLEKGFVDPKRLVITGGSYGGYMTAWIVGHSDRFVAAAAQRGVYNLLGFGGVTDIPSFVHNEFGVEPWEDPMFLWENSPLAYADKIKTPLLLIHSENDFRVPISEGEQLFAYVRRTGGTVRLVRFPRDGHEMTRSGEPEHRISSLTHIIDWFDQYAKPAQ